VKLVRVLFVLAAALAVQTVLGRFWPEAPLFVDVMLIPVVWYGIAGSQRSGMLVGCAAGLLQDAWFQLGVLGLNGFKKTLLGWVLGGLGTRFDLNRQVGRLVAGALASLADSLLDVGLRRLLDLEQVFPGPWEIALKALVSGLLVAGSFGVMERLQRRRALRGISY
jgi:rod shape-determining protein MreD